MTYRCIELPLLSPAPGVALHLGEHRFGHPDAVCDGHHHAGADEQDVEGAIDPWHLVRDDLESSVRGRADGFYRRCFTLLPDDAGAHDGRRCVVGPSRLAVGDNLTYVPDRRATLATCKKNGATGI